MKLLALGLLYFKDAWNWLDTVVVVEVRLRFSVGSMIVTTGTFNISTHLEVRSIFSR